MINEKEYLNWIEGKKLVQVSSNGDSRFALMEKNGIPDMQFMVMLFYEAQALKSTYQILNVLNLMLAVKSIRKMRKSRVINRTDIIIVSKPCLG